MTFNRWRSAFRRLYILYSFLSLRIASDEMWMSPAHMHDEQARYDDDQALLIEYIFYSTGYHVGLGCRMFARWMGRSDGEDSVWSDRQSAGSLRGFVGKIYGQRSNVDRLWRLVANENRHLDELDLLEELLKRIEQDPGLSIEKEKIVAAYIFLRLRF